MMKRSARRTSRHQLHFERLESRQLMAGLPLGAVPDDTAEFMLGRVAVTPVFFESQGTTDASTENWTQAEINEVLTKIRDGMSWWTQTLSKITTKHTLEFVFDERFARNPVPTQYEPISRNSEDNTLWVGEFLDSQGYMTGTLDDQVKAFNNAQRIAMNADWSFSIFIADASNDSDGRFQLTGNFSQAFAYPGGLYIVAPSVRPSATFTHEVGHIFWAFDEYPGGDSYLLRRGVYNAQNLNAIANPAAGFVQQPSIMAGGSAFETAYFNHVSSASTLAHIGWKDSDGDGIFDVLDVPLQFNGLIRHDAANNQIRLLGNASAVPYLNQNSDGNQSDITLNRVRRLEYRVDGGTWQTLASFDSQSLDLNQSYSVPATFGTLELRFLDTSVGVTSPIMAIAKDASVYVGGGLQGVAFLDANNDNAFNASEAGLAGWSVTLLTPNGLAVEPNLKIDASTLPPGTLSSSSITGAVLKAPGELDVGQVYIDDKVGNKTLGWFSFREGKTSTLWPEGRELSAEFSQLQRQVSINVIGAGANSYGRLEAFDINGNLLARVTSTALAEGEVQRLTLSVDGQRIASIRAGSQGPSTVKLDHIVAGTESTTVTDASGRFAFGGLADGAYQVEVTASSSSFIPAKRFANLVVSGGVAQLEVGFASNQSPWQNVNAPANVDGLRGVEPLDALIVINAINVSGPRELGAADPTQPYLDVNGDRQITPIDALQVINVLNLASGEYTAPPVSNRTSSSPIVRSLPAISSVAQGEPELDFAYFNSQSSKLATIQGIWVDSVTCGGEDTAVSALESESTELFAHERFQFNPEAIDFVVLEIFA